MSSKAIQMSRIACGLLLVGALLSMASCASNGPRSHTTLTRLTPEEIQTEVMAFADSYTAIMSQAADRVATKLPEQQAVIHDLKLHSVHNAIIIAAGPNPAGALLDMMVMVELQHEVVAEYWMSEERYGEAGRPVLEGLELLKREIWSIAGRALDEERIKTLETLIPQIRERYRGQVNVSAIRASDFVEDKRASVVKLKGGRSLLQLFHLDPLAGLSPASRELAQTRLLAERALFYFARTSLILNWQVQGMVMDMLAQPDPQRLLDAAARVSEAGDRLSTTVAELPQWLPQERAAAIDQLFEHAANERKAIMQTFENEEVRLRGLLEDVRLTVEATSALSASLNTMVGSTDTLLSRFDRPSGEPRPDGQPFRITDYQATVESLTVTVRELNRLAGSLHELLATPAWQEGGSQLTAAVSEGRETLEGLIDRVFVRAIVVVLVLVASWLLATLVYRFLTRRLVPAPGRSAR